MELFDEIAAKIKGQNKTIVFPEGEDKRILGAAVRLKKDNLVEPILLVMKKRLKKLQVKTVLISLAFKLSIQQLIQKTISKQCLTH